jgi:crotonobetainyl-CoA:carnitine CoA-transferase CaiB-like acyl-CoA transferase
VSLKTEPGQQTDKILIEMGYSEADIADLKKQEVI